MRSLRISELVARAVVPQYPAVACLGLDLDREDVEHSLAGDGMAYARLIARHQGAVARQMRRFARERSVIDELVQDVFVSAYLSLRSYRGEAQFGHWLSKVATRVGFAYWKSRRRDRTRRDQLASAAQDRLGAAARVTQLDPAQAADLLHALLDELPPQERLVLLLLHLERRPIAEVCDLTGWTRTTVYVRAFRARAKMRALCDRLGIQQLAVDDVQAALRLLTDENTAGDSA